MRMLLGAIVAALTISTAAFAGQTEGHIKKIDTDAMTITLDDGKAYKMNPEMDVEALKVGMDIVIAFDVTDGENIITDMNIPE